MPGKQAVAMNCTFIDSASGDVVDDVFVHATLALSYIHGRVASFVHKQSRSGRRESRPFYCSHAHRGRGDEPDWPYMRPA